MKKKALHNYAIKVFKLLEENLNIIEKEFTEFDKETQKKKN